MLSLLYLPTFSEIKARDFYPGSAGIFEDDMIISEDSRRSLKSSEDVRKHKQPSHFPVPEIARKVLSLSILHMVFVPYMGLS